MLHCENKPHPVYVGQIFLEKLIQVLKKDTRNLSTQYIELLCYEG